MPQPHLELVAGGKASELDAGWGQFRSERFGTQVGVAVGALFAWAVEHQRQPSGGVRGVLVPDPANRGAGPYVEFALPLRTDHSPG